MDHDERMGTLAGLIVAALIVVSLVALLAIGLSAVVVSLWTIRSERADRALRDDLDQTLSEILGGPPSRSLEKPNSSL
jgi:uncharacterized membrane protein